MDVLIQAKEVRFMAKSKDRRAERTASDDMDVFGGFLIILFAAAFVFGFGIATAEILFG
jgi:hypothetical protein